MPQVLSVMEAFGELEDPRSRVPAHDLTEMLVVALAALLSGADSWIGVKIWGRAKLDWLRKYLLLRNGIASHDTFGRVFAALDPGQFETCFIRWVRSICPAVAEKVVAIDGKTVRGSHQSGQRAIHLVSAFSSQQGLVLGQSRTADHSNEITAIPELLDALLLKGAIVTIDAMGCQPRIAEQIIVGEADYVLAVKGNQPGLQTTVHKLFDAMERYPRLYADRPAEHCEVEKGHGRIETRRCVVSPIESHWPSDPAYRWPRLRSLAMVESTRDISGVVSTQRRYYISSLPADEAQNRPCGAVALAHRKCHASGAGHDLRRGSVSGAHPSRRAELGHLAAHRDQPPAPRCLQQGEPAQSTARRRRR